MDDLQWAWSGALANVVNGEAITVVQNRVEDAGFADLDIIPLVADRVFLRSKSDKETFTMLGEAKYFFDHFFKNIVRWEKAVVPSRRGAWLRLYGIPLHAWNENFFKLCVMECGSFLHTDDMSLDKGRFDYASVLISTPSLSIVSRVEGLSIDGQMVDIKIIEEWGLNIGEDACLFEDEEERQSQSDNEEVQGIPEVCNNADIIVDKIVKDLEEDNMKSALNARDVVGEDDDEDIAVTKALSDLGAYNLADVDVALVATQCTLPSVVLRLEHGEVEANQSSGELLQVKGVSKLVEHEKVACIEDVEQGKNTMSFKEGNGLVSSVSGPPFAGKPVMLGPWSTEWLKDHHGDAGVLFTAKRKFVKAGKRKVKNVLERNVGSKRRKTGGELRNLVYTLKKVARLSSKDRRAVLKTLQKRARKRRVLSNSKNVNEEASQVSSDTGSSSASVNKEWNHWVVLHGRRVFPFQ